MVGNLLLRGMLAGLIAGLLAFCLAWYLGEPQVDRAIQFEEHAAMAEHAAEHAEEVAGGAAVHDHGDDEEELVSRGVQGTIGLLTGVVVYGIGLGGCSPWSSPMRTGGSGRSKPEAWPCCWPSAPSSSFIGFRASSIRRTRRRSASRRPSVFGPVCSLRWSCSHWWLRP